MSFGAITAGSVTGGSAKTAGGTFSKLVPPLANPFGPPNSVGNDNFQSPNLFGFDEVQNFLLTAPLAVDVGNGPLPAGALVQSHYVFFDPGPSENVIGLVDFDSDLLGVITSDSNLASSDFLANSAVNYLNPSMRGLEAGDSVTISGQRQIGVDLVASSPGDYVRVITGVLPSPSLAIRRLGANVILVWPTNPPGFHLQFATNLAPSANWFSNTQSAVVVTNEFLLTNPIAPETLFFRLAKP